MHDQTNIDKNRLAANITEYHIISKLIFLRIIIPKLMMIRQLYDVKMYVIMNMFKIYVRTFWYELESCYDFYILPAEFKIIGQGGKGKNLSIS